MTPYGVIYDNGIQMEELYDGIHFPCYLYDQSELVLGVFPKTGCNGVPKWLYLPMPQRQLERLLERDCLTPENAGYKITNSALSAKVRYIAEKPGSSILELNEMCAAISALDKRGRTKLDAVIEMAGPENPLQIERLAKSLDQFDFVPNICSAGDYGRYLIQESGRFSFDENLDSYYNYQACGQNQMDSENGMFVPEGYVICQRALSLDELLPETSEEQDLEMGGL